MFNIIRVNDTVTVSVDILITHLKCIIIKYRVTNDTRALSNSGSSKCLNKNITNFNNNQKISSKFPKTHHKITKLTRPILL